jgi:hypothetical protein
MLVDAFYNTKRHARCDELLFSRPKFAYKNVLLVDAFYKTKRCARCDELLFSRPKFAYTNVVFSNVLRVDAFATKKDVLDAINYYFLAQNLCIQTTSTPRHCVSTHFTTQKDVLDAINHHFLFQNFPIQMSFSPTHCLSTLLQQKNTCQMPLIIIFSPKICVYKRHLLQRIACRRILQHNKTC